MLLFHALLILTHFWPASTLLRGHLALAILSPLETDPQILERWGYADEVHLGKSVRAKDFSLECMRDVQQLSWSIHVGSVSACLCTSVKSMKTSAAPDPGVRNPIVVYLLSCTQRVFPFCRNLFLPNWSSCFHERNVFQTLFVGKQRISPFYRDLHLLHERNMFRFPENEALFLIKQQVSPFYHDYDFGLVGMPGTFLLVEQLFFGCRATSEPTSFFPFVFQRNLWKKAEVTQKLPRKGLLQFHPNSFRNTISWECIVKDDAVRSRLIELQFFLLSKFDVDPIHHVVMFLPCFVHVLCKTWCTQVDRIKIPLILVHGMHKQKEYYLSVPQILTSRYQSWICDGL